jgi:hypothetical protein
VSATQPTPDQAAGALAEAKLRESQVRRTDGQLAWILAVLATAAIGIGILMSLAPHLVGPAVAALYLGAIAAVVVVFLRIRAYSRAGLALFTLALSTFTIWNALIAGVSVATRWWSASQPSYHFGVGEAIAVVPLLVGIWVLSHRRV